MPRQLMDENNIILLAVDPRTITVLQYGINNTSIFYERNLYLATFKTLNRFIWYLAILTIIYIWYMVYDDGTNNIYLYYIYIVT